MYLTQKYSLDYAIGRGFLNWGKDFLFWGRVFNWPDKPPTRIERTILTFFVQAKQRLSLIFSFQKGYWGALVKTSHWRLRYVLVTILNESVCVPVAPLGGTHRLRQPSKQHTVPVKHVLESSHRCFSEKVQWYATGSGHCTVNTVCSFITPVSLKGRLTGSDYKKLL